MVGQKVKWLKEGDANTAFFHKATSNRINKDLILYMEINDTESNNPDEIKTHILSFDQ